MELLYLAGQLIGMLEECHSMVDALEVQSGFGRRDQSCLRYLNLHRNLQNQLKLNGL